MASQKGQKYGVGPPRTKPLDRSPGKKSYFFLEGKLYKMIKQDRSRDILSAWDFEENRIAQFLLTEAKKKMRPAYTTVEVAQLLNRNRATIQTYVNTGKINSPVRIHEDSGRNRYGKPFDYMKWSEDDILALHDYLLTLGRGRPRKDGILREAPRLPSRRELIAMMRQQPLFYMQTADGDFVPVWMASSEV